MQRTTLGGLKNLFTEIQAQINLFSGTNELRAMQLNCYFAHLKNLLLAMLGDEDKNVRAKADLIILKDIAHGSGVTYLTHKKGYLVLHEPPFKIAS